MVEDKSNNMKDTSPEDNSVNTSHSHNENSDEALTRKEFLHKVSKGTMAGVVINFGALFATQKVSADSCTGYCASSCHGGCKESCWVECADDCGGKCEGTCDGCDDTCDGGCDDSCEESCEGKCDTTCEGSCKQTCNRECNAGHVHTWNSSVILPIIGNEHYGCQSYLKCSVCGAIGGSNGSVMIHDPYQAGSPRTTLLAHPTYPYTNFNDANNHIANYYCERCNYGLDLQTQSIKVTEAHNSFSAVKLQYEDKIRISCGKCGYYVDVNVNGYFDVLTESKIYNMLAANIYSDTGINLYSSSSSWDSYIYGPMLDSSKRPIVYLPKNGSMSLSFDKTILNNGFKQLGYKWAFGTGPFYIQNSETIHLNYFNIAKQQWVTDLLYSQDASTPDKLGTLHIQDFQIPNFGDYGVHCITFKETNRFGVVRNLPFMYKFCEETPALTISEVDSISGTGSEEANHSNNAVATPINTIYHKGNNNPHFNLNFEWSNIYTHNEILEPWDDGPLVYTIEKLNAIENSQNKNWVKLVSGEPPSGDFQTGTFTKGTNCWTITSFTKISTLLEIIQESNLIQEEKYNPNEFSKYRITISARNKVGNVSTQQYHFFLDWGVDISPKIVWEYSIPTKSIPEYDRLTGKDTSLEIDFDRLCIPEYKIVHIKIFDDYNFKAIEGFSGQPSGTEGGNNASILFRKNDQTGGIQSNQIKYDPNYNNKRYVQFDLTIQDFLNWTGVKLQSNKVRINRVRKDPYTGIETLYSRFYNFPTNIWNVAFPLTIEFHDWVGNVATFGFSGQKPLKIAADHPGFDIGYEEDTQTGLPAIGFSEQMSEQALYTPAYCPDIQLTSVTIKDNAGVDPSNPENGNLLEVAVLPTFRDMSSEWCLEVYKEGETVPKFIINDLPIMGEAAIIGKNSNEEIEYGSKYKFVASAINLNGYHTVPSNEFYYTMNRNLLTIDKIGEISGNETWHWRYRLIGDVIVTGSLSIKPGASVIIPESAQLMEGDYIVPSVFADKRTKIIVKKEGTLVIDGTGLPFETGTTISDNYVNTDGFIILMPSGLDAANPGFKGENNWGGIYFERDYKGQSFIRRARILGAYDGIIVFGKALDGSPLKVEKSIISTNYIGIHVCGDGALNVEDSVIGSNLEYGIKTDGGSYKVTLTDTVGSFGYPNKYADYYSGKKLRRLGFDKIIGNGE